MAVPETVNPVEILNQDPFSLLLHGDPKIGKTTLAGGFPAPRFIACPRNEATSLAALPNARSIKVYGVDNWKDFCDTCLALAKEPATEDFQTMVIDTATQAYSFCLKAWEDSNKGAQISQNTWTVVNRRFLDLIDAVLRLNKDKNLLILAHSRTVVIGEGQGATKEIAPDFGSGLTRKLEARLNGIFYLQEYGQGKRLLRVEPIAGIDVGSRYRFKGNLTNPTADDIISKLNEYKDTVNGR